MDAFTEGWKFYKLDIIYRYYGWIRASAEFE